MLKFREFSVTLDATPRPIGTVTIPAGLAATMVAELRRMLLAHEDGRPFVVDVFFTQGRPVVMGVQRVDNSACAAQWSRHDQLLAVTIILSGLDPAEDVATLAVVSGDWGVALSESQWEQVVRDERPVIVNLFLAPGSFSDPVIRGGIACLGGGFGILLGTGEGEGG
jgi:hypothetical protein